MLKMLRWSLVSRLWQHANRLKGQRYEMKLDKFFSSNSSQPSFQETCGKFTVIANYPADTLREEINHLGNLRMAMRIATEAHKGQVRKDGSATIDHSLRVAQNLLLAGVGMDSEVLLCAGLLHDVLEDGGSPGQYRDAITVLCEKRVLALVEAVTKPPCRHNRSKCPLCEIRFIFRILVGSVRDPAILHLKLADIADNLGSVSGLSPSAAHRYVRISRIYIRFSYVRLGVSSRSCHLCAARLREAEVWLGL